MVFGFRVFIWELRVFIFGFGVFIGISGFSFVERAFITCFSSVYIHHQIIPDKDTTSQGQDFVKLPAFTAKESKEAKGLLKHWKTSHDTIGEDMCPFITHTLTKKVYDFTEESDSQLVNIEP